MSQQIFAATFFIIMMIHFSVVLTKFSLNISGTVT